MDVQIGSRDRRLQYVFKLVERLEFCYFAPSNAGFDALNGGNGAAVMDATAPYFPAPAQAARSSVARMSSTFAFWTWKLAS